MSQDIEKLLKNNNRSIENSVSNLKSNPSSPKQNLISSLELVRLQKAENELKSSCEFYKKALEEHIIKRKQEEQKNLHSHVMSDSQLQSQNKYLFYFFI